MESPSPQIEPTPEAYLVGEDFIPGASANSEIDQLLGKDTVQCGSMAVRDAGGGVYSLAPDYCGDESLTTAILEKLNAFPLVLQTADTRKKPSKDFTPLHVAMFSIGDDLHFTKPQETHSQALACVAWHLLSL